MWNPELKYDENVSLKDNLKACINWCNFAVREISVGRVLQNTENTSTLTDKLPMIEALAVIGQITTKELIRADTITKEQMLKLIDAYPNYEVGKAYTIGDIFVYNGEMFEVIQTHTSQSDWIPSTTASLYKNKTPSVVIPNWVQPIGSTDAYKIGDKVIFDSKTYESTIDANVWSPTGYPAGWKLI